MYKDINDNEVIYMINDSDIYYETLLKKYSSVIQKICFKYLKLAQSVGYELNDLIQIGNISLLTAIHTYKESKNILFYTYMIRCIDNNIKTELRKEKFNTRKLLNESISYNSNYKDTEIEILNYIEDKNIIDPLDFLVIEEKQDKYIKLINKLPLEVAVTFEMRNDGFSTKEISRFLETDEKTVYRNYKYAKERICLN